MSFVHEFCGPRGEINRQERVLLIQHVPNGFTTLMIGRLKAQIDAPFVHLSVREKQLHRKTVLLNSVVAHLRFPICGAGPGNLPRPHKYETEVATYMPSPPSIRSVDDYKLFLWIRRYEETEE